MDYVCTIFHSAVSSVLRDMVGVPQAFVEREINGGMHEWSHKNINL